MSNDHDDEPEHEPDYEKYPDDDRDPEPPDEPTLGQLLAEDAHSWGETAAVWLLDTHGHWLPELERTGLITELPEAGVRVRWIAIHTHLGKLIGTTSELQVLAVARALASHGAHTTLGELTSLDEVNRRLVLHAVAWAAGGEDWATSLNLLPPPEQWRGADDGAYSDVHPF